MTTAQLGEAQREDEPRAREASSAPSRGFRDALHAEWTKARTVSSTGWLLLGAIAVTVAIGVAADVSARCAAAGCGQEPAKISLTGIYLGQAVVAIVGVLAVSNEYSTGMIRVTLAAKAVITAGLTLAVGTVAVLGSVLAGRFILPGHGFTAAHGYAALSLGDGPVLRAAAGSVLYLALIALLSLGAATAVRDAAVAIGAVLGVLFMFPIIIHVVTDTTWQRHLEQLSPMTAGLYIQATTGLRSLPLSPWQGLGVLAAWAAGALLLGGLLLRLRDA